MAVIDLLEMLEGKEEDFPKLLTCWKSIFCQQGVTDEDRAKGHGSYADGILDFEILDYIMTHAVVICREAKRFMLGLHLEILYVTEDTVRFVRDFLELLRAMQQRWPGAKPSSIMAASHKAAQRAVAAADYGHSGFHDRIEDRVIAGPNSSIEHSLRMTCDTLWGAQSTNDQRKTQHCLSVGAVSHQPVYMGGMAVHIGNVCLVAGLLRGATDGQLAVCSDGSVLLTGGRRMQEALPPALHISLDAAQKYLQLDPASGVLYWAQASSGSNPGAPAWSGHALLVNDSGIVDILPPVHDPTGSRRSWGIHRLHEVAEALRALAAYDAALVAPGSSSSSGSGSSPPALESNLAAFVMGSMRVNRHGCGAMAVDPSTRTVTFINGLCENCTVCSRVTVLEYSKPLFKSTRYTQQSERDTDQKHQLPMAEILVLLGLAELRWPPPKNFAARRRRPRDVRYTGNQAMGAHLVKTRINTQQMLDLMANKLAAREEMDANQADAEQGDDWPTDEED
ncbi:hypothetical protein WJX72_008667 [[Myrmecia] bisecta]|uniref:Uncharacterized protein n=1 Tax=[Myrmecia] bisecta TaxID=41462 RepID=A0AAW1PDW7_9CHLO